MLEVDVFLQLLIEKSLQIKADLVIQEVYEGEAVANETLVHGGVLEAEVQEFAVADEFPESILDCFLPFNFIIYRKIINHIINT